MATEGMLDSVIPAMWERQERTEVITRANYARMVAEYGLTNSHIGDVIHINVPAPPSVATWSEAPEIKKVKPTVFITND